MGAPISGGAINLRIVRRLRYALGAGPGATLRQRTRQITERGTRSGGSAENCLHADYLIM